MAQRATGTQMDSPVRLAIGTTPADAPKEQQAALQPVYSSLHSLVAALRTYAGAGNWPNKPLNPWETHSDGRSCRLFVAAGEVGITRGSVICLVNKDANSVMAVLASATSAAGRRPNGVVVDANADIAVGQSIEVQLLHGLVGVIGNLTPGTVYYQSTTNGIITPTAPSGTGIVAYVVGKALTPNTLLLDMQF